jgi:uncharacterized damage-inducible protein DinB
MDPEPWLSGTLLDVHPVQRAVLHALQLAENDLFKWCEDFLVAELNARPANLPSLAFQVKHIARSIDRLLTYAEGGNLNEEQLSALEGENDHASDRDQLFSELRLALSSTTQRIMKFDPVKLDEPRTVGRKKLPTTVAGLLIHVAEHTQRHVGQAITTAKVIRFQRSES